MEKTLGEMLKKYVSIFVSEYSDFLSSDQLETLRNIDYDNIISFSDNTIPFGNVSLGKIYLSKVNEELINNLKNMPSYNTTRYNLNNKNLSSYLQYMCENGYNFIEYMGDILMYFVFMLVIKNHSGFIYGIINQEIKYLNIKYSIRGASLYAKEEFIIYKITPIFKIETLRKILFMDRVSAFKYLNENFGYRYANFIEEISELIDLKYKSIEKKDYSGFEGFLNYTEEYDCITYTDAYNLLLDFEASNNINY